MSIKKDFLHPENNPEDIIYPATSIDQVEGLNEKLTEIEQNIEDIPSGGGAKLYLHKFPVTYVTGSVTNIGFLSFISTKNVKNIITNEYEEITLDTPVNIVSMIPNSFNVYYQTGYKSPRTVLQFLHVTHVDFSIVLVNDNNELAYISFMISFTSMDDESYTITEL